jgi:hypothetical protein
MIDDLHADIGKLVNTCDVLPQRFRLAHSEDGVRLELFMSGGTLSESYSATKYGVAQSALPSEIKTYCATLGMTEDAPIVPDNKTIFEYTSCR